MVRPEPRPSPARPRAPLVPWRVRVEELARRLLEESHARRGPELEAALRERHGAEAERLTVGELARALEDLVVAPGTAGDGRSLLRAFAEEAEGLEPAEREQLLRWERERRRAVYVVERCLPDLVEAWDPVEGRRETIHLPERLPGARCAEVARGTLLVVVTVPWTTRLVARGPVEFWSDPRALPLYRAEVRQSGRTWHDLPPAAPAPR